MMPGPVCGGGGQVELVSVKESQRAPVLGVIPGLAVLQGGFSGPAPPTV